MPADTNNHSTGRRRFLKITGGAVGAGLIAGCSGDGASGETDPTATNNNGTETSQQSDFPSDGMQFLIPYSTGGGYNYYSRLTVKYLNQENYLPVEVQAQNRTGGGGVVGHNAIYSAEPTGYTNGIINPDSMAKAQLLQDEARFDLSKMTIYPRIAGSTTAIGVGTHTDISSGSEFINAVANGDLKIGQSGVTSYGNMIPIALGVAGEVYGADMVTNNDVQFDGKGQWLTAMKRGDVDVMAGSLSSLLPYVESGDLRIALVLTTESSPPEEVSETDTLSDVDVSDPEGVVAMAGGQYHRVFAGPPDIPSERAEVIREALKNAIQNPDLQSEAQNNDRPINFLNSEDTANGVTNTIELWQENIDLLERLQSGN